MEIHTWYIRAKCTCGYIWTTNVHQSVTCACGASWIGTGDGPGGNFSEVTDEDEFKQAVSQSTSIPINELIIEHGGT